MKKIKTFFLDGIAALILSISVFLLIYAFFDVLKRFNCYHDYYIYFAVVPSFFTLILALIFLNKESTRATKVGSWLSMNYPNVVLSYSLLLLVFCSIKTEIIWTYEKLISVLSLEWAIFGIEITIFLAWNVLARQFITKKDIGNEETLDPFKRIEFIAKKSELFAETNIIFGTVKILILHFVILAFSSYCILILNNDITLFTQDLAIGGFLLCAKVILQMLIDIIRPLYEEKNRIQKRAKVTKDDVNFQNNIYKMIDMISEIEKDSLLSKDEKEKMISLLLSKKMGKATLDNAEETKNDEL